MIQALTLLALAFFSCNPAWAADEESFIFETWDKQKVEAFKGSFNVPENRRAQKSRLITIKYVRLAATGKHAGPPIVYLSGGPGSSGVQAINYRYRLFMAMREHGDVIALDQRGTGASNDLPRCTSKQVVPATTALSDQAFIEQRRAALKECLAFWKDRNVDLAGYNTVENAHDLEALRRHLGAQQIILWGTSYGSHLALAALKEKEVERHIAKVLVSSVEGLNHTIKLPALTDVYLDRLQDAINGQPAAKAAYPGVKALMRRVHARLEREPMLLSLTLADGSKADYLLQRRDLQSLAGGLISDPRSVAQLLGIYLAIDRGAKPSFGRIPARLLPDNLIDPRAPVSFDGMPVAMDMASGITSQRQRMVAEQAQTAVLGPWLDDTFHFDGLAPELDLGDAFRAPPTSAVPILALGGTLDGRTDIESQRESVSALKNITFVTVKNAGHNLFDEASSDILQTLHQFMEGKPIRAKTLTIELPDMAPKSF